MESDLLTKIERLLTQYEGIYDLDIARLKVVDLTDEEFELIKEDRLFKTRLNIIDAGMKENIMINLIDLSHSVTEAIKLKATLELGKIFYQKKFNEKNKFDEPLNLSVQLVGVDTNGSRS
jgi:oligoribonuclease NrnB/cAMP/cGMP phosphodiesterase (DHH superfamily)